MADRQAKYAVLGYPLTHSFSPQLHNPAFEYLGMAAVYEKKEIVPGRFDQEIRSLKQGAWGGFNITIPYKQRIMEYLDAVDPTARRIGAVNTIKITPDGKWVGYNTDYTGFLEPLKDYLSGIRECVLIGAGGASLGAAYGLLENTDLTTMTILNRTVEKAERLKNNLLAFRSLDIRTLPLNNSKMVLTGRADLIINATSIGMRTDKPEMPCNPVSFLKSSGIAYDLIYNPRETAFLRTAREAGMITINGLPMLVGQGTAAFELWTGKPFPEVIKKRFLES